MVKQGDRHDSPDDIFADTRMSFGEHLEELRIHLWKAILGFLVCLLMSFFIGKPLLRFIAHPVEVELQKFYDDRVLRIKKELLAGDLGLQQLDEPQVMVLEVQRGPAAKVFELRQDVEGGDEDWIALPIRVKPLSWMIIMQKAEQTLGRRPYLATLSVQEAFMAYFMVCMMAGFVIGSPWIFYQLWLFVAAGLYPHEKRYVNVYLPFSLGLFLGGVFLCEFFVIPKAIEALLWFNQWIDLEPDIRFNEWLGFAILMPLVFGVSFQVPLVMLFLERIGIMTVESYLGMWKIALFGIHVFAAVITPSIDLISMELLAIPMFGLYLLGIFMCRINPRESGLDIDVPDSEEQVGV